jgi:hypothetical protein
VYTEYSAALVGFYAVSPFVLPVFTVWHAYCFVYDSEERYTATISSPERNTMMNKMILTAAAAFVLAAGNAHAQYSQYGAVENFYHANIDVDNGPYAGRVVNPAYWLVDWNQWTDVDSRWTGSGYVRLGVSSWESDNALGGGAPVKYWALAYASVPMLSFTPFALPQIKTIGLRIM